MRPRIIVSPAEKRNVTIDRCPPIKSREICTSPKLPDVFRGPEIHVRGRKFEERFYPMPVKMNTFRRDANSNAQVDSRSIEPRSPDIRIPVTHRQQPDSKVPPVAPALCVLGEAAILASRKRR
jgi:hypothetical protein